MPAVTRARASVPSQPLRRPPRRLVLPLALALGAAACGPEATPENGNGNAGNGGTSDGRFHAAVTAVTPRGLTLTLAPGVPGILPEDLTLAPAVAIATVTAADMSNTRYVVATQARFALGQEYTLTITKAGYRITSPRFTRRVASSAANITNMTLTVAGVEVRGRITDTEDETSIHFLGGAKATPVPLLTGIVSLKLSVGARVAGTSPAGTEKTYTSTGTRITIRAEDDTTTKTYSIRVADYDANTNPYGVYTIAQLHAVRNGRTDSYRLMQSLTLPGLGEDCEAPFPSQDDYCAKGFSPIGLEASPFTGTFDGNGQRIQNLAIRRSATDSVGLFGHMGASGEIRRLGVVLAAAGVTGDNAVGGLVGTSGGIVAESYVEGAVSGKEAVGGLVGKGTGLLTDAYAAVTVLGKEDVGGLAGRMEDCTVTTSYAEGAVTGSGDNAGGLVGRMEDCTVTKSYAEGVILGDAYVGGLVGRMEDCTVTDVYAVGAPSARGAKVGGLVGDMQRGAVSQAYATGWVNGSTSVGGLVGHLNDGAVSQASATGDVVGSSDSIGGLVGRASNAHTVSNAYATGDVFGDSKVGGLLGNMDDGAVRNAYAVGAVSGGSAVGGLVGHLNDGAVHNAYAVGTVFGDSKVGGFLGNMDDGAVSNAYATGAVSGGSAVGGLVGQQRSGTVTDSYYPFGRPGGAAGTALSSWPKKTAFDGFDFGGATPAWKWVDGKWPQLQGFQKAQPTPNLAFYTATVSGPSTSAFTITLQPALSGLTETNNWALHNSSTNAAVNLYKAAATIESSMGGGSYAFAFTTTPLAASTTYRVFYVKPNVIVVPKTSTTGHIAVEVP